MPPARPIHIKLQKRIEKLLEELAGERGVVVTEFPYRPVLNLQYWVADIAYVPRNDWDALPPDEYPVYAPPLIVDVLSPSDPPCQLNRKRIVAMSAGTQEFWVVDSGKQTVQVTDLNGTNIYAIGDSISLTMLGGVVSVEQIFAI